jgi:H+/Cl- antiporter ClcA
MVKKAPMTKGSGIPQVKGVLAGYYTFSWLKEIIIKFTAGVISIGFGLSLGREGPSVQLGAETGSGISHIFRRVEADEKYLITCGAAAGLTAAFNAPLAGIMFALEELTKNFSPFMLASIMAACVSADYISCNILGLSPVFNFKNVKPFALNQYLYIIVLGIIIAFIGFIFNKALLKTQDLYNKINIKDWKKPIIAFLIAGILGFILPEILGGGHNLIINISNENMPISFLFILLTGKFIFTMISYGSGVPGGIFLPMLVIGGLSGNLFGQLMVTYFGMEKEFIITLMVLSMAAIFTSVVKAPLTGCVLILEMTGSMSHFLGLVTVCFITFIVSGILKNEAIYEVLLNRMLKNNKKTISEAKNN